VVANQSDRSTAKLRTELADWKARARAAGLMHDDIAGLLSDAQEDGEEDAQQDGPSQRAASQDRVLKGHGPSGPELDPETQDRIPDDSLAASGLQLEDARAKAADPPKAAPATAALRAVGLGYRYGRRAHSRWAVNDCEFTVPTGRITALVGRKGSGKSTLLHLATDLIRPHRGEIDVFGYAPGTPDARRRTAFVAQGKPLYDRWTVADTLRLGLELNDIWDQSTAERIVQAGGIPRNSRVSALSWGQRSRVALALALGKGPELLLLDDLLADLEPLVRDEVMEILRAEVAERGLTVVLSSPAVPDIEHLCDHVLLLRDGRIDLSGNAEALRAAGHTLGTEPEDTTGEPTDAEETP
jgi:ABC-2 type transport system ATP-binding protein